MALIESLKLKKKKYKRKNKKSKKSAYKSKNLDIVATSLGL